MLIRISVQNHLKKIANLGKKSVNVFEAQIEMKPSNEINKN